MQLPSGTAGRFFNRMALCGRWPGWPRHRRVTPTSVMVFASSPIRQLLKY